MNYHGEFALVYRPPIRQNSGYQHSAASVLLTSCIQIIVCCRSYLMHGRPAASQAFLCPVNVVVLLNCDNEVVFWYCLFPPPPEGAKISSGCQFLSYAKLKKNFFLRLIFSTQSKLIVWVIGRYTWLWLSMQIEPRGQSWGLFFLR